MQSKEPSQKPERKTVTMHRLTPDAYKKLEESLLPPNVTNDDTMLTAGVKLGIQQVLRKLREGYITGEL